MSGAGSARMVREVDERWQRAVAAASGAGVVARLVFSTGISAQALFSGRLISESELAEYEAIPLERRAVWEQTDLLERSRIRVLEGGIGALTHSHRGSIAIEVHPEAIHSAVPAMGNRFPDLREFDLATGVRLVAGADEAGRACLAGPLVAAACLFEREALSDTDLDRLVHLRDSKKVSPSRRRVLRTAICELAVSVAVSVVSPAEKDRDGHDVSNVRALREAVSRLEPAPEVWFTDWYAVPDCRYSTTALERGDGTSAAVAAASIHRQDDPRRADGPARERVPRLRLRWPHGVHQRHPQRRDSPPRRHPSPPSELRRRIYRELGLRR